MGVDAVKKFTDRNNLSISSCWSEEIYCQKKYEYSMGSHIIHGSLDYIDPIFSSECAELEVEAISEIASLESEIEISCIPSSFTTNFDDKDDDDISEEFLRLEESERLIKEDLSSMDILKYETKRENQK